MLSYPIAIWHVSEYGTTAVTLGSAIAPNGDITMDRANVTLG